MKQIVTRQFQGTTSYTVDGSGSNILYALGCQISTPSSTSLSVPSSLLSFSHMTFIKDCRASCRATAGRQGGSETRRLRHRQEEKQTDREAKRHTDRLGGIEREGDRHKRATEC